MQQHIAYMLTFA